VHILLASAAALLNRLVRAAQGKFVLNGSENANIFMYEVRRWQRWRQRWPQRQQQQQRRPLLCLSSRTPSSHPSAAPLPAI
jgi:hypothetical protein